MPVRQVVRDGISGGVSFDVLDDNAVKVGRVDIIALPSGRRFWERYDANDNFTLAEGEIERDDARPDAQLVEEIWRMPWP